MLNRCRVHIKKNAFLLAITLAALAGPGWSAPTVYTCQMSGGFGGWIPKNVVFIIDPAAKTAEVIDGLVASQTEGKPMPARFRTRADGKYRLNWALNNLPTNQQRTLRGAWTADLDPKGMTVFTRANLSMGSQSARARGTCVTS